MENLVVPHEHSCMKTPGRPVGKSVNEWGGEK